MAPLHEIRFNGESDEYRAARNELLEAEIALRRQLATVNELRHKLPLGGEVASDYEFEEWDPTARSPSAVRLSELFADGKDTLLIYSFMWVPASQGLPFVGPCPSCTSIIDGIDGAVPHIIQRLNFVVSTIAPIEQFHEYGASRGWRHSRLLSSRSSSYNRDYQAEKGDGNQWPLANLLVRRDGKIRHFWSSELWLVPHDQGQGPRDVDFVWPIWGMFDLTPEGRADFEPQREYG